MVTTVTVTIDTLTDIAGGRDTGTIIDSTTTAIIVVIEKQLVRGRTDSKLRVGRLKAGD
jgi:hypothetical protein